MFPTLSSLFEYLFHIHIPVPIQTFGFFVALAFLFPYYVFRAEFKRKEEDGLISAFTEEELIGTTASWPELIVNGLLGFLLGFKAIGAIIEYKVFASSPMTFIFSGNGSWLCGIICAAIFVAWIYIDRKKDKLPQPIIQQKLVHPYQLCTYLVFMLAFFGFIGAKLFNTVEYLQEFFYQPVSVLFSSNGFSFYGGLIFGALTYLYIGQKKGMKLITLADIGSPGMMLAYGIGRIGCQLAGDGDWGIVNNNAKPGGIPAWMWSFKYPHNAIDAGIPIPGCIGNYCHQLSKGVYPTPFYEAAICILFFTLMWLFRKKITTPGVMFFLYLVLNGGERFLIEQIRINPRYNILGMQFTQAGFIGLLMLLGGVAGFILLAIKQKNKLGTLHTVA
ncbi:prolipoprotein diacylglyceryl transferase family protein [Mucilaginibacter sabulilitoris]|uniref:Prolipoprotein diacylglyceryl transferase family protein n=1 Tax=Mucilaginibacter sabulilitoris TaxID=1173583 RepID=A0ABZ0TX74_9SPHI|nr:prolipoprotein diacylglyceryl transferase family protein [Mucilaginibacter sabulilitoris]WPU96394.1 prolipoprotein diacylglyceryl transferase family protein [Mucilaginibacter sabulilitoris]